MQGHFAWILQSAVSGCQPVLPTPPPMLGRSSLHQPLQSTSTIGSAASSWAGVGDPQGPQVHFLSEPLLSMSLCSKRSMISQKMDLALLQSMSTGPVGMLCQADTAMIPHCGGKCCQGGAKLCRLCETNIPAVSSIHVNAATPAQAIHGLLMLEQPYRGSICQCGRP